MHKSMQIVVFLNGKMPVNFTEKRGISWHAQLSVLRLWLWRSETHKIAYTNAHYAVGTFYLEHFLSKFWHREHEIRVELPIIATLDKSRVHNSYWERENADAYTIPTHGSHILSNIWRIITET